MDAGIILHPAQIDRCTGVQQQHDIVKVVVQVLEDLQFHGIRLEVGLGLVLFHIGMIVHRAGHIAALASHTAEHKNGNSALHGVGQTRLCFHDRQGAFVDGKVLVITVGNRTGAQTVVLAVAFGIKFPECFVNAKACIFKSSFHIDLIAADVADGRMADKTEGRIRAVRHLASVVFQQNDALCGDLLVQCNFILNQSIQRIKAGLAVFHIDVFGLCLAVVDASALQAQNALHAAGVGRDQHIGRNYTARQCDTQHTRNGSFDDLAHHPTVLLFLCHNY